MNIYSVCSSQQISQKSTILWTELKLWVTCKVSCLSMSLSVLRPSIHLLQRPRTLTQVLTPPLWKKWLQKHRKVIPTRGSPTIKPRGEGLQVRCQGSMVTTSFSVATNTIYSLTMPLLVITSLCVFMNTFMLTTQKNRVDLKSEVF